MRVSGRRWPPARRRRPRNECVAGGNPEVRGIGGRRRQRRRERCDGVPMGAAGGRSLTTAGTTIPVDQTPLNLGLNGDLLAVIPRDAPRIVEVGCSGGGLAREYRKINPRCEY